MKLTIENSKKLIQQSHKVWSGRMTRYLSDEDARQMVLNVTEFFKILAEWSRTATPLLGNEVAAAASSKLGEGSHD
jgi:hypothetical protein